MRYDNEWYLKQQLRSAAAGLRELGYAISIFSPGELGSLDNQEAEEMMVGSVNGHIAADEDQSVGVVLETDCSITPMKLLETVASRSIWGMGTDNPLHYDECEVPEGTIDSHECLMDLIENARACTGDTEHKSVADFRDRIARLSIWDWANDNGEVYKECEMPDEGHDDSHTCLMDLIIEARQLVYDLNGSTKSAECSAPVVSVDVGVKAPQTITMNPADGRSMGTHHSVNLQWWWRNLGTGKNPPFQVLPMLNQHLLIEAGRQLVNGIGSGNIVMNARACMSDPEEGTTYQAWWEVVQ